jgi:hypothetical protein
MINYEYIHNSILHYEEHGFKRIESPWTVSEEIQQITIPDKEAINFKLEHNQKCLVGSGEQSFLYLYLKGFLPKGQFQTVTPCFRYNNFDILHTKYFIKNELIKTDVTNKNALLDMCDAALAFYQKYIPDAKIVRSDEGWDIEVDGKELGSYGHRRCSFLEWLYGTGCAEPRLSMLIQQYGIPQT